MRVQVQLLFLICSLAVLSAHAEGPVERYPIDNSVAYVGQDPRDPAKAPAGQESQTPAEEVRTSGGRGPVAPDLQKSVPAISVRVETRRLYSTASVDTVDIVLESDSAIGGFDLKLMVDNRQVKIVEVLPGRLIDSCRWEFFNSRELTVVLDDRQTVQTAWQITALPELIPDSVKPACYGSGTPTSLCRLVVSNTQLNSATASPGEQHMETRILFVWEDCSDNTMSSFSGKNLWLSSHIVDSDSTVIPKYFPNNIGAAESCITARNTSRVKRLIDFQGGVILFQEGDVEKLATDSSDS